MCAAKWPPTPLHSHPAPLHKLLLGRCGAVIRTVVLCTASQQPKLKGCAEAPGFLPSLPTHPSVNTRRTVLQWHPEKPPTEFSDRTIPHSQDAVRVSQHLANVFVHLARRSPHKPESLEQELEDVIYNYHW